MIRTALLVLAALTPALAAAQKPTAVVPRLKTSANLAPAVQQRFDERLREALGAHVAVADAAATDKALAAAGVEAAKCGDAACARKVAAAAKVRFVVLGEVTNADEIYKVQVQVFDSSKDGVTGTKATDCELCAVDEVDKSIIAAVDGVKGPLTAAAASAVPAPPPAPPPLVISVKSDPPGATVQVDGQAVGQTPVEVPTKAGQHRVVILKEGFAEEVRELAVLDKPVAIELALKAVPVPEAPASAPVEAEPVAPPVTPVAETSDGGGSDLAPWAWGFALGGVAVAGAGMWLVSMDGDVTCTDGRGRTECPNVYDTKYPGSAIVAVGAGALGAGIAMFILDPGEGASTAAVVPTDDGATAVWSGRF